jgi:hypothetical protein
MLYKMRLLKLTILYNCSNMESNKINEQPQSSAQFELEITETEIDQKLNELEIAEIEQENYIEETKESEKDSIKENNIIDSLIDFIKGEFINILVQMVNEFDLVFDYVDKSHIKKLKKYIKTLVKSDTLEQQMNEYNDYMSKYEKNMQSIINTKKIKTQDLEFLNEIQLFDGFKFDVFKDENKSTKKTIVQYLYNMLMSCQFSMTYKTNKDNLVEESDALKKFTELMSLKFNEESQTHEQSQTHEKSRHTPRASSSRTRGNPSLPSLPLDQLGDIGNVFNNILANKDIMNLATDISKDLENQKIDPMTIMSGLLTGKPSPMLNNLVNKITSKLETKINSGEVDKNVFEEQAKNILNAVNNTDLTNILNKVNKKH